MTFDELLNLLKQNGINSSDAKSALKQMAKDASKVESEEERAKRIADAKVKAEKFGDLIKLVKESYGDDGVALLELAMAGKVKKDATGNITVAVSGTRNRSASDGDKMTSSDLLYRYTESGAALARKLYAEGVICGWQKRENNRAGDPDAKVGEPMGKKCSRAFHIPPTIGTSAISAPQLAMGNRKTFSDKLGLTSLPFITAWLRDFPHIQVVYKKDVEFAVMPDGSHVPAVDAHKRLVVERDGKPAAGPIVAPVSVPVAESIPQPVAESIPQLVAESIPQPVAESIPQPVAESIPAAVVRLVPDGVGVTPSREDGYVEVKKKGKGGKR